MKAIEIARKFAELKQPERAQAAYSLAINENNGESPEIDFEAACYILFSGGQYEVSFTCFCRLYNEGHFQSEIFDIMVKTFYAPNVSLQQGRYEKNCRTMSKYPYIFRNDFVPFEELPIKFFPYGEGFVPFYTNENRFGDYINFNNAVITRNFFKNLDNPILATDLFSQYELEYLNDNVRKSEWVARENHIYLHYTDWSVFCSYLPYIAWRELLKQEKFVFLIEDEKKLYPIDFKERFGIDYTQNTVKPVGIREVNKMIWHTQLSTHNGGDFFNEIFDAHPNLLAKPSIMFDTIVSSIEEGHTLLEKMRSLGKKSKGKISITTGNGDDEEIITIDKNVILQLTMLKDISDKDIFVSLFLGDTKARKNLDKNSRISPAIFFQPHFHNIDYEFEINANRHTVLYGQQYEKIRTSGIYTGFKYIKTFTPMRRITTSYAASVKFMYESSKEMDDDSQIKTRVVNDAISTRMLNRSFMIDWQDRLYKDSTLVRFEDGKLNPKATFTALAAFLDLPYTESMTYCSYNGELNPESLQGNVLGFDPATVYRTYDDFANDTERYYLEYFFRDVYEYYGYDFKYYDGEPIDEERAIKLIDQFTTLDKYVAETFNEVLHSQHLDETDEIIEKGIANRIEDYKKNRLRIAKLLMGGLYFVNRAGQPLRMMTPIKLNPELLENPIYH